MNSQNPCEDTLVTATGEVLVPGATDFINVLLDKLQRLIQSRRVQAIVRGELYRRFDPELGLSVGMIHVDVHSWLFAREKVEPKSSNAKNRWTHTSG